MSGISPRIPGLEAARWAPSAHNTQPWLFRRDGTAVTVGWNQHRELPAGDPDSRYLFTGLGAAVGSLVLGAAEEGLSTNVQFHHQFSAEAVATIVYEQSIASGDGHTLAAAIPHRRTTRLPFRKDPVPTATLQILCRGAATVGLDLAILTEPRQIKAAARAIADGTALNLENSAVYREFYGWLRLTTDHPGYSIDGLNLECLSLSKSYARLAPYVMPPERIRWLCRVGAHRLVARSVGTLAAQSPVLCLLIAQGHAARDLFAGGRAMMRVWLRATDLGLRLHPVTAAMDHAETRAALADAFGVPADASMVVCFRLGYGPQSARSPRLPAHAVLAGRTENS